MYNVHRKNFLKVFLKTFSATVHGQYPRAYIKDGLSPSIIFFVYFNESPLKMVKNTLYFMLKVFVVFEEFTFMSWFFGY